MKKALYTHMFTGKQLPPTLILLRKNPCIIFFRDHQLIPLLQSDIIPKRSQIKNWGKRLLQECHELLSVLLPLRKNEMEFLSGLNEHGEIMSELLAQDVDMQAIISEHPALRWKAQNVREYRKGKQ